MPPQPTAHGSGRLTTHDSRLLVPPRRLAVLPTANYSVRWQEAMGSKVLKMLKVLKVLNF
jgi:hypothetical protein